MSHAIDIDGIQNTLFVLRHLSHGTEKYCIRDEIKDEYDLNLEFFDGYWGRLKVTLSNNLIEVAAKVRMIEEYCRYQGYKDKLKQFEEEATGKRQLGIVKKGRVNLSLREASNKIIHATHAEVNFKSVIYLKNEYLCWDGAYSLFGQHSGKDWEVVLDVESWAKSLSAFLELLEESEIVNSMGHN
jgi:hypothetical protein